MESAITVENLSKRYQIGMSRVDGYRTLRESIADGLPSWWRRFRGHGDPVDSSSTTHWALKGVSFDIQPGEVVGIIGRNGAGKSTLLKILSRITEPTSGRAVVRGRIGSLLEVGTGFHPELTGRENIYLNGSILGMSRREIDRKFAEIVEFAEIDRFLDTPVKRYSSGMFVRLAFSVAAHLEPEILLVDEVLAVGDATYQKRCIDRMSQIARSGRSVLFVSHNMDLIPRLCRKAIRLEQGRVRDNGAASAVVDNYHRDVLDSADGEDGDLSGKVRSGEGRAVFTHVWLVDAVGQTRRSHPSGEDLRVRVRIRSHDQIPNAALAVNVMTVQGARIHSGWTREIGFPVFLTKGVQEFECQFHDVRIRPGQKMKVGLWLEAVSVLDSLDDVLIFEVIDGRGTERFSTDRHQGNVLCNYTWSEIPRVRESDKASEMCDRRD